MNIITTISKEFDQFKPRIEQQFKDHVQYTYDFLVERYGLTLNKISSFHNPSDYTTFRQIQYLTDSVSLESGSYPHKKREVVLNYERIEKKAKQYANDQVAGFIKKLESKIGDLDSVEVKRIDFNQLTFVLTGKLGDNNINIEQQIVFKVSNKGTPFVQWPARIRLNGNAISEKKFKEWKKENI